MLRRICTICCSVVIALTAIGQLKTPDFAYPKTVLADAEQNLGKAGDNGLKQLEALMQIYVAKNLIDKGTAQQSLESVISYGNKQTDKQLHSLFTLYSATIANDIYRRNQWVYNRRELPLTPRPQDMTEWSGSMFNAYIDSLCNVAVQESGDMPISSLSGVIEADELSLSLFPFLRDFAVAKAMELTSDQKYQIALLHNIIDYHKDDTAPHYAWMAFGRAYDTDYRNRDNLLAIYNSSPDKRAALVLWTAILDITGPSNPVLVTSGFVKSYSDASKLAQNSPFATNFTNFEHKIRSPHASARMQGYYPAGASFTFELSEIRNLEDVAVTFRGFDCQDALTDYISRKIGLPKVTRTFNYHVGSKSVIDTTLTATATLPCGYYSVSISDSDSETPINTANNATVTVVGALPVLISSDNGATVSVYEASTGAPKANVTVALADNKNKVFATQKSDTNGLAVFRKPPSQTHVRITDNGFSTDFPSERIFVNKSNGKAQLRATTTTQNGVYHPGDTMRFVTVAMYDSIVASNKKLTATLYDSDDEHVATMSGVTDTFGRIDGVFAIPEDIEQTGRFAIAISDGTTTINRCYVTVSDFKLGGVQLTELSAVTNMPADSTVTVSGKVKTYSGQPLSGTSVSITLIDDNDALSAVNAVTNDAGTFTAQVPLVGVEDYEDNLQTTIAVTSPDGETITGDVNFIPQFRYTLDLNVNSKSIDISNPFDVFYKLTSHDTDSLNTPVAWTLNAYDKRNCTQTTVLSGMAYQSPINISNDTLAAGEYTLEVVPTDSLLANVQYLSFSLYNSKNAELPEPQFYIPNPTVTAVDGKAKVFIGTDKDSYIYVIGDEADKVQPQQFALKAGYHTVTVNTGTSDKLYVYNVSNGVLKLKMLSIKKMDIPRLDVILESFRDMVTSGSNQQWRVTVKDMDKPIDAAVIANIHDYRLDKLQQPTPLSIFARMQRLFGLGVSIPYFYDRYTTFNAKPLFEATPTIAPPQWLYNEQSYSIYVRGSHKMEYAASAKMAMNGTADMLEGMVLSESVATGASDEYEDTGEMSSLRIPGVVNVLWAPSLMAVNGTGDITFNVPNANSTWTADITVWTKNLQTKTLTKTFTSHKPVMVSVNAPRFLRVGDKAQIIATYMNATDSVMTVTATLGCVTDSVTQQLTIPAYGVETLSVTADIASLKPQCIITARAMGGGYGDGERHAIPVLPSQAVVNDSRNFYINPGDSLFTMELPQPVGQDFRLNLTYTENPMWAVVEALPTLFDNAESNPTANAQAAALFSASIAVGLMESHPELEYTFNPNSLNAIIQRTTNNLLKLQTANGSIQWGTWSRAGDLYTTLSVLDFLSTLKNAGYLKNNSRIDALIRAAVTYCDNAVRDTDLVYTIVRPSFSYVAQSLNGCQVTDRTIQWIIKNWRKFDISIKAEAATAMHITGNDNMARKILGSIDQFGTKTPSKGYEFKNVTSLQTYAWLLKAYSSVGSEMSHLNGIRQYLIMRKQTTDWGNSAITSWIVNAMITSGTPWVSHAKGVHVSIDGQTVSTPVNECTGTVTAPISGSELTIKLSGNTPSYGAVTAQYVMPMEQIKAFSDGEVSVDKRLLVLNRATNKWVDADSVRLGDNLKVLLTVKADRPMSHVIVNDRRAAAFEPVVQLPRFVYADGVCAYLENRDAVTNLYVDYLPKGTYLFEYELKANNSGEYASGIATATCAMAPTVTAHSSGTMIYVKH